MSTPAWIEALKSLQETDLRIRALKLKQGMVPKEKLGLKNRAAENRDKLQARRQALLVLENTIKKTESEILRLQEHAAKLQQQSSMVKKNTEYQAMMSEIAETGQKISNLETVVLEKMDELATGKGHYHQEASDVEVLNAGLKDEFRELEQLEKDLLGELARLDAERVGKIKRIESSVFARYQSLIIKNTGTPLAPVINGICDNCHLRITPQTYNSAKKGEVAFCDNCQHFVYVEE